ncbi:hypothetical protein [Coprobacter sp.]
MKQILHNTGTVLLSLIGVFSVSAQEYINDTFSSWKNAGALPNVWTSGSQSIVCKDQVERTFTYENCVVDNTDMTNAKDCPAGVVLVRNSNNGKLTFPVLPNIGKVMIAREGKAVSKNARMQLQVLENGTWVTKENDAVTSEQYCEIYSYAYRSEEPVQIRLVLSGSSATRLYWIYVEGLDGGSGIPDIPVEEEIIPDETKVVLYPNRADTVAFETLVGISGYGWDPINKGIYINWHRDFPNQINNTSGGDFEERNTDTRHDAQNDIRALQHYYWFKALHNNTDFFDRAIKRLLPTVKSKYAKPSIAKGWLYYVLLRLMEYTDNPDDKEFWENAIMYWGQNVYNMIDHDLGVYYQTNMGNCDCGSSTIYLDKAYRVDHQVEAGAAMVHAGTRFNKPEWVDAGFRQVLTTYEHAFSEKYGMFGRIYLLGNSGYKKNSDGTKTIYDYSAFQNKLWDGQAKLGEVSEEADALLKAAAITTNPEIRDKFVEIATKMLDALRIQPVHDRNYGGFYQMMYVADSGDGKKAGKVMDTKKEMRQASLLGTYNFANRFLENQWQDMEREMYYVLVNTQTDTPKGMFLPDVEVSEGETINGYRKTLAGYSFQLSSDWSVYGKSVAENWVSNESNSLILLGLFEYLTAKYVDGYDDSFIMGILKSPVTPERNYLRYDRASGAVFFESDYSPRRGYVRLQSLSGQDLSVKWIGNNSIDVSALSNGVYFVSCVETGNLVKVYKLYKY